MWHVETDYFALAIFLIMFIKESPERARKRDRQGNAFFIVLLLSIVNVIIDIVSSLAMNQSTEWWMYEYAMTLYVASMPLLAAVWVCYEYVLIHRDAPQRVILRAASWRSRCPISFMRSLPSPIRIRSGFST